MSTIYVSLSELYSSDTAATNCSTQRLLQIKAAYFFGKLKQFSTGSCPVARWEVMETKPEEHVSYLETIRVFHQKEMS